MTRHLTPFPLRLARTEGEVAAAQALRHRVFVEELGARGGALTAEGREADRFDAHCEHLLLFDALGEGVLIGTTRLMTDDGARQAGGFATEDEFDIAPLRSDGRALLEVGRTCLLPGYRGGAAMHRLWQGLATVVEERGIGLLFGLVSFQGIDPKSVAQPLSCLFRDHLAAETLRPRSLRPLPVEQSGLDRRAAVLGMPALLKAYLRLGARVGDGACLDPDFGCIDVCMVLETAQLSARARAIYGAGSV